MLKEADLTAGEIADAFHISKPSISHHLDLLKQAGLISVTREGQFLRYSLDATVLEEALQWILDLLDSNENHPDHDTSEATARSKSNPDDVTQ